MGVWQTVLGELEVSTDKMNFLTWLKNTKLVAINDGIAVVSVPNTFILKEVERRYSQSIVSAIQKHDPTVQSIQFVIDSPQVSFDEIEMVKESEPAVALPEPTVKQAPTMATGIIGSHTFATFVEGTNNRFAYTVSYSVAQNPGTLHNPLFIYGGVGLGKTHLMHAIANHLLATEPTKRVRYVSSEQFTNDYIGAIGSKQIDKFKQMYRSLDLLLIDDIQFIANKEGTQEEFFNTFNTLHSSQRQIVVAADRAPQAIPGLEERLSSRFSWGMVVDIQPPNLETRLAILKSKCADRNVQLPDESIDYIAAQFTRNIRELEGALNRVITYCQMNHVAFTQETVRAALSGLITPVTKRAYPIDGVLALVADFFQVSVADVIGKKRVKELVYPRQITMVILREDLGLSFPEIGRELGGKDHTTIMHGYNKLTEARKTNTKIDGDIRQLQERLIALS